MTTGSETKTVNSLCRLNEPHAKTRIGPILMRANQSTVEANFAFRKAIGHNGGKPNEVYPGGRDDNLGNAWHTGI